MAIQLILLHKSFQRIRSNDLKPNNNSVLHASYKIWKENVVCREKLFFIADFHEPKNMI
jgi:hypothetical protein